MHKHLKQLYETRSIAPLKIVVSTTDPVRLSAGIHKTVFNQRGLEILLVWP